jgi:hypothetical protein
MFDNVKADYLNIDVNIETEANFEATDESIETTSRPVAKRKMMKKTKNEGSFQETEMECNFKSHRNILKENQGSSDDFTKLK